MIPSIKILPLLLLILLLPGYTVTAQQSDSLLQYLEQAAANNPGLKAKYLEYSAALEKVPQAASLPDPELQFGYFIKPMQQMNGNQVNDIRFMQMFPWFGTLKAAKDEASKMALARYEEMRNLKFRLFKDVKISWYRVYRTKKEIDITEQNLEILKGLERLATIRLKSGEISSEGGGMGSARVSMPSQQQDNDGINGNSSMGGGMATENTGSAGNNGSMSQAGGSSMGGAGQGGLVNVLRVQIEIRSLENRLALLKDQLQTDKIRFNSYLNRPPLTDIYIDNSLMESHLPYSFSALADSLEHNPMIRMLENEKAANESKLNMVTRMGYPMIGLGLNYSVYQKRDDVSDIMNGEDMIMPMITLTLPVYRKKYNAMKREASYQRDAAGSSADQVYNELIVELQTAYQLYLDADRRIKLNIELTGLAEKSISLQTAAYRSEGTDFEEILRLQQQWLDYQFQMIAAAVDKNSAIAVIESLIDYNQ
ncbi:MAG TPA: TolC family protein [Cyclobacteriaceae bacterium]|nr:TolC family protein [Cyclobacteriaceae bacterium]